jgi:hypothetical protein
MGRLKHEGDAVDVLAPSGSVITYGEVYRIDGWTGFAMANIALTDTERKLALETSPSRVWYFSVPTGLTVARGALLTWSGGSGIKVASTDLVAGTGANAVVKCEEAKDSNNVIAGRVMQQTADA